MRGLIMTRKQIKIEEYQQRLIDINNIPNSGQLMGIPNLNEKYDSGQYERYRKLRELALEVGATYISVERQKTANEGELTDGIHKALQTASMIEMCRISARNFWVAVIASIVAFISVLIGSAISFLSMVATWVAALVK
jgi:hypothetical protein